MGSVFTRPSYISYFLSESYATLSDHINILQQENDIENYVNEVQMQRHKTVLKAKIIWGRPTSALSHTMTFLCIKQLKR